MHRSIGKTEPVSAKFAFRSVRWLRLIVVFGPTIGHPRGVQSISTARDKLACKRRLR